MESIKTVVLAVCGVAAARSIIMSLAAASKLKNNVMSLLNLLLAAVLITPFAKGLVDFSLPELPDYSAYSEYRDVYTERLAAAAERNVADILAEQIAAAGIVCGEISAEVNISADNCISIKRVTITAEDFESAALIVKGCLGAETEVVDGADQ